MYKFFFKRLFDLFFSFILFIILLPFILIIFISLIIKIGSPIYIQNRPGQYNKIFKIYKFKTIIDKDCRRFKKKNKYFKLGLFLRKTGLDELPQLINIIKGDVSFVGPRPLLVKYLRMANFKNHHRSKCKPGVTGLVQIANFSKKKLTWKKKFDLDQYYYFNLSFYLDLKILFFTLIRFFKNSKPYYNNEPRLVKRHFL